MCDTSLKTAFPVRGKGVLYKVSEQYIKRRRLDGRLHQEHPRDDLVFCKTDFVIIFTEYNGLISRREEDKKFG